MERAGDAAYIGKAQTICGAVCRAAKHSDGCKPEDSWRITDRIDDRLGDAHTLTGWLYQQGHVPASGLRDLSKPLIRAVQAHRKAWALALADEFEQAGD